MSEGDLRKLIRKRATLKGSLTKFQKQLEETDSSEKIQQIKLRLPRFEALLMEFETLQLEIEDLADMDCDTEERQTFEDTYYTLLAEAKSLVRETSPATSRTVSTNLEISNSPVLNTQIKLPQINVPKFDGKYDEWSSFKDLFDSIVHRNHSIGDAQKLLHLNDALSGEAKEVIKYLRITNENYTTARELLINRYDKKHFILSAHIQALFDLQQVTRESATELRQLISTTKQHLGSINAIHQSTDNWDPIIIALLKRKLDKSTIQQWAFDMKDPNKLPTLEEFIKYLENRCTGLEATPNELGKFGIYKRNQKITAHVGTNASTVSSKCKLCFQNHNLYQCEKFTSQPIEERIKTIQSTGACFNCLRRGHSAKNCRSTFCKKCNGKHHTLIHKENNTTVQTQAVTETSSNSVNNLVAMKINNNATEVLLATAVVLVKNYANEWVPCRALLDSCSQSNFMTNSFVKQLQCTTKPARKLVNGIATTATRIKQQVCLECKSRIEDFHINITCLVLPDITINLPTAPLNIDLGKLPKMPLADPTFAQPQPIDLLIGAEWYFSLLKSGQIKIDRHLPFMQETTLGWIISGPISNPSNTQIVCHLSVQDISDQLEKFWNIEEVSKQPPLTKDETEAEEIFQKTHYRDATGRFVVKLPIKQNASRLGNSATTALHRFDYMRRKFERDEELKSQYHEFMDEYEKLQHMTKITRTREDAYFIPHHAVIKETSTTTRLRVVFDGSAKTTNGTSLNDLLLIGPKTQSNLFDILIRFRQHTFVICADIEKMYRQVLIAPEDRHMQQIYWQSESNQDAEMFQLNTITYGLASSPFLACRCIKQLAIENKQAHPTSSIVIDEDFYVDDLLSGGATIEDVARLKNEITTIFQSGQFNLRKWRSNAKSLIEGTEPQPKGILIKELPQSPKTLGLDWEPEEDYISYSVQEDTPGITKRQVLSQIAKLYDPLGLLAPIILKAKVVMQQLWQLKTDWDEPLTIQLQATWTEFVHELAALNALKIPRSVVLPGNVTYQLHIFSDASEKGYGSAVYLRTENNSDIRVQLLCAKSRVAPLKNVSLPRLELTAALLSARLADTVIRALRLHLSKTIYWSDSTITLHWINTEPHKMKTFVANRVAEIQSLTKSSQWYYIPTACNAADVVSRGCSPAQLLNHDLWWNGPQLLREPESTWVIDNGPFQPPDEVNMELKPASTLTSTAPQANDLFKRFSTWPRMIRVLSYCLRFIRRLQRKNEETHSYSWLSVLELIKTETLILKIVQGEVFQTELKALACEQQISKQSCILHLKPFTDAIGLIRVGGRLSHAIINAHQKHPVLLSKDHYITELIMKSEHIKHLHCGPEQLLSLTRLKYWIISGRSLAKRITRTCVVCFRSKPTPASHLMGDLPASRVRQPLRPFANSGVDYAGPIRLREGRRRGRVYETKGYICIFVCMATRAVHLELVSSLSAEAFLAALYRFMSRRGICTTIHSDNGTNFVGANRELSEMYNFVKENTQEIAERLATRKVSWSFIPPRAPHFGGIWEAAVKAFKRHFHKIVGNTILTFEECMTIITQIEAILNSRPLTPLSTDLQDLAVLTPAHFLIGNILVEPASTSLEPIPDNRLSRHQLIQKLRNHFWTRWHREYLQLLQSRRVWKTEQPNLVPDVLVLIMEDNVPPLQWNMGRITATHPGADGVVRVVSILTPGGKIIKRPTRKLCVLPKN